MSKDVLTVGMDLGASKTAVVASNGRREVLPSIVGWPKDRVARSMLGKDVLFGQEVLDNRLAVRMVRPFEKGMLKYRDPNEEGWPAERIDLFKKVARLLIQRAVSLVDPNREAKSLRAVIGVPSRASVTNQQTILEAAETVLDQVIVIPEPFAVAYDVDRLQNTLVIDIGASTIDICPMCGVFPGPEDQVTIPFGGDHIDEEFHRNLGAAYPEAQLSINMARDIKERFGFVHETEERALAWLPIGADQQEFDVTEPLKAACQKIIEPLLDGAREVLSRVDPEFRPAMLKSILLSGGGSQLRGLDRVIESAFQLFAPARATRVHDCLFAGASGAFKLAMTMGHEQWEVLYRGEEKHEPEFVEPISA